MIREASRMDRPVESGSATRRRRWWVGLLVLGVLGAGFVVYPSVRRWASAEASVELSRIRLGEVSRGTLVRDVAVQGNVVAANRPTLVSPTRGTVRVEVREGAVAAAGEVLVRIDSPELGNQIEQERSTLLSLEADVERQRILSRQSGVQREQDIALLEVEVEAAERAMRRAERTRELGLVNEVEYERTQDTLKIAGMRLDLARQRDRFEAETLELELQDRRSRADRQGLVVAELERQREELAIRAPVAGLVSQVRVNEGDTVAQGDELVTVVDLSAFELEVAVPESFADELSVGMPAQVSYEGRDYTAEVRSIAPVVEGSRVRGRVTFTEGAPDGLKQNQRLTTRILLDSRPDVLKVPRGPFLEAGGGRQVYVIEDGTAVLRSVTVGALSVSEVEIASGLAEGERIVLSDTARFEGARRILLRD